jgi:hypothetical protein
MNGEHRIRASVGGRSTASPNLDTLGPEGWNCSA